jgi:hypothetical protein
LKKCIEKYRWLDGILVLRLEEVLCGDSVYGDYPGPHHQPVVLLAGEVPPPVHFSVVLTCNRVSKLNKRKYSWWDYVALRINMGILENTPPTPRGEGGGLLCRCHPGRGGYVMGRKKNYFKKFLDKEDKEERSKEIRVKS